MAIGEEPGFGDRLCSVVSKANGEDLAGYAIPFEHRLLVEVASPWEGDVGASRHYPEGLWDALMVAWRRGFQVGMTAIQPDPEYSVAGCTRLTYLRRPDGPFAAYERVEYLLPDGDLISAVVGSHLRGIGPASGSSRALQAPKTPDTPCRPHGTAIKSRTCYCLPVLWGSGELNNYAGGVASGSKGSQRTRQSWRRMLAKLNSRTGPKWTLLPKKGEGLHSYTRGRIARKTISRKPADR